MKNQIPNNVSRATKTLKDNSFEAFLVGGCVRDLLRDAKPTDWDITTNAKPEEIIEIFEKEGIRTVYENTFGTVAIVYKDEDDETEDIIEITPYRTETKYSDNRHPDSVKFADNLSDDLKRRDFTINAMAMDIQTGEIVDLFDGKQDLENKIIRAVGDASERFNEDALRMLRAVRFSSQLGFEISRVTLDAVQKNAKLLENISGERIRDEFFKLIMGKEPMKALNVARATSVLDHFLPEMAEGVGIDQSRNHVYDVWEHQLRAMNYAVEQNYPLLMRVTSLFHDIGKPRTRRRDHEKEIWTFYGHEVVGARIAKKIAERLRFPREFSEKLYKLVRWHMFFSDPDIITLAAVRRMIANVGHDLIWDLMILRQCDRKGMGRPKAVPYRLRKYQSMIDEALHDPVSVKQLKLNGDYMIAEMKMKPGPRMGWILHALLEEVLDDPKKNTLEYLKERTLDLNELDDKNLQTLGEQGKDKRDEAQAGEIKEIRKQHRV